MSSPQMTRMLGWVGRGAGALRAAGLRAPERWVTRLAMVLLQLRVGTIRGTGNRKGGEGLPERSDMEVHAHDGDHPEREQENRHHQRHRHGELALPVDQALGLQLFPNLAHSTP